MIGPITIDWLSDTLLATSLMMALVLLIRRPVTRAFGPGIAYLLWTIPAARCVMPALTGSPQEAVANLSIAHNSLNGDVASAGLPDMLVEPSALDLLLSVLPMIWLGGAIMCLTAIVFAHWTFRRRILAEAVKAPRFDGFRVVRSPAISLPLAIGIIRPLIVVPIDFETHFGAAEKVHILRHEAEHHRHGDLWANIAAACVLSTHWFNPLAWLSWNAFRLDQEKCCDARVTAQADVEDRALYAATLAKAVIGPGSRTQRLVAPMVIQKDLKERLIMLKDARSFSRSRTAAGVFGIGLLLATGLIATATVVPAIAAQDAEKSDAMPQPPQPPLPPLAPAAPTAPVAPTPPIASPAPPAPPTAQDGDMGERHVMIVRKEDGKRTVERRIVRGGPGVAIPSEAEIRAMLPEIDTARTKGKCDAAEPVITETIASENGKRERIIIRMCADREMAKNARASAIDGLREARAEIAQDSDIPGSVKAQVLSELEAQIAKMQAQSE